tara:strand:- start:6777 stop:7931 length:1155 start_codon:yes stop_codon:yes gene_type:complete
MSRNSFPYQETILQWLWEEMLFSTKGLKTTCGKSIQIIHQGTLNLTDGPDFKQAKLLIDGLVWHGSVEMHLKSTNWKQHGHQSDSNYNNVILHVVVEHLPVAVTCSDGNQPFTLNLLPHLNKDIEPFLKAFFQEDTLPCANVHFISEAAFLAQLEKAHLEYLEKKVSDFFSFYNPESLQSAAWKNALMISIFDGFGISQNRVPMQQLAHNLQKENYDSLEEFLQHANELAFDNNEDYNWNYKSARPANHPAHRVKQAVEFSYLLLETPFSSFLKTDALNLWKSWGKSLGYSYTGRIKIIYGTVFIPALYALASMFAHQNLKSSALKEWCNLQSPIPKSLLAPFQSLPIPAQIYSKKLGSVYQLHNYCRPKQCSKCFVLKKAFQS